MQLPGPLHKERFSNSQSLWLKCMNWSASMYWIGWLDALKEERESWEEECESRESSCSDFLGSPSTRWWVRVSGCGKVFRRSAKKRISLGLCVRRTVHVNHCSRRSQLVFTQWRRASRWELRWYAFNNDFTLRLHYAWLGSRLADVNASVDPLRVALQQLHFEGHTLPG